MAGEGHDIELPAAPPRLTIGRMLVLAVVAVVYWQAVLGTEISIAEIVNGLPPIAELLGQMFPPDWAYLPELGPAVLETLQIGIVAHRHQPRLAVRAAL